MTRWFSRYHLLQRDELESELLELCLRLRGRKARELQGPPAGLVDTLLADAAEPASRRRYITVQGRADFDFPRVLAADEHACALLRALNDTASLLHALARPGRRGRRGSPS